MRPTTSARLGAFYAAIFLVAGIQLPFWPLWLAGRGLGPREIAAVFAAAIWLKVIATPALGALADRRGRYRTVMVALSATAVAAYAGLWPAAGLWTILALNALAATALSALMPLADSVTLSAVRSEGADYGRIRVWGSLSFVVAAIASGALLAAAPASRPSGDAVLLLVLGASGLLALACLAVPPPAAEGGAARPAGIGRLAADRRFWLFVAAASALQASHQLYYGFGTLYWRTLGFSDAIIGVLWAEGVVAEIVLFWRGRALAERCGPLGLMALGGVAGILRWGLCALVPGLAAAAGLQLLHALTFGASHLGAMHFLARTVPPGAAASAQSLYVAVSAGIGSGVVMLAAGALYAAFGGNAYLFMALLSAAGLVGTWGLARLPLSAAPATAPRPVAD